MPNMPSFFPDLSSIGHSDTVDDSMQKRQNSRLANRKAMMELLDMQAAQGINVGVDDAARMARDTLGVGAYLNSTAPSTDMLGHMTKQYNDKAAQVQEQRRIAKFKTDNEEKGVILGDVHDQYLSGKSPVEVLQYAQDRYGSELLGRLNLNFDQEQQKALWKAEDDTRHGCQR